MPHWAKAAIYLLLGGYVALLIYYAVDSATPHDSLPGFTVALYTFFLEPLSLGVSEVIAPIIRAIPLWPDPPMSMIDTVARVCTATLFSLLIALGVRKFG